MNTNAPESPVIGIDPGYNDHGYVVWDPATKSILEKGILNHVEMVQWLRDQPHAWFLMIEMFQSYGMAVGKEVFDSCTWVGRFEEAWAFKGRNSGRVYRSHVKSHHCHNQKATDSNIRCALIDKYGPIGTVKMPGPLYGVTSHQWSALAIATYAAETGCR